MLTFREKSSILWPAILLFFLCSCTVQKLRTLEPGEPIPFGDKVSVVYQGGSPRIYFRKASVSEGVFHGAQGEWASEWGVNRRHVFGDRRTYQNHRPDLDPQEVRLYVKDSFDLKGAAAAGNPGQGGVAIPLDEIYRVEIREHRVSAGRTVLLVVATAAVVAGIILVASNDDAPPPPPPPPPDDGSGGGGGGSCPYIYAFDGEELRFVGEIFGGATLPSLERDDYLPLPDIQPIDGEYRLEIANELNEVEHTNLTELLVVDHAKGSRALFDKYGVPHVVGDLHSPRSAMTLEAEDVLREVECADGMSYAGTPYGSAVRGMDGLDLSFDRPLGASEARLVVHGKNSVWLEHVHARFAEHFGDMYGAWKETSRAMSPTEIRQWTLEQGIPLSVYVENEGRWEFVDTYPPVGPLGSKDQVMNLDLSRLPGDELKVRLQFGSMFWEIDCVEIDFDATSAVDWIRVPITRGLDEQGVEVSPLLVDDDDSYYVQPEPGNRAALAFKAPPAATGLERTVVLHGKGYYEVPRDPQGPADIAFLSEFLQPGRLGEFSREEYLALLGKLEE